MSDEQGVKNVAPVNNHRERETGVLVYPVNSRRAQGLSIGINLFPGQKACPFDCPYCEVFPFTTDAVFSLEQMEADLRSVINNVLHKNITVKDICFSGNGEPSLSVHLPQALQLAESIRDGMVPSARLVLISNGAGLVKPRIFSLLAEAAAGSTALDIWLKIDAGTPAWYAKMNRSAISYDALIAAIRAFAAAAPLTIQTMLCAVEGQEPPPQEVQAWQALILELVVIAANGTGSIRKIQIYGKARPSPDDPQTQPLPVSYLEGRASSLRMAFSSLLPEASLRSASKLPCSLFPAVQVYP